MQHKTIINIVKSTQIKERALQKNRLKKEIHIRITYQLERQIQEIARLNNVCFSVLIRRLVTENLNRYIPDRFKQK